MGKRSTSTTQQKEFLAMICVPPLPHNGLCHVCPGSCIQMSLIISMMSMPIKSDFTYSSLAQFTIALFFFHILTSVRGLQVPCRYPDQCQGFAGALQVSWPVSGVCRCPAGILTSVRGLQVPCRCPDQCQGFTEIGLLSLLSQCVPGCVIRGLPACTGMPHRESNCMGGRDLNQKWESNWRPRANQSFYPVDSSCCRYSQLTTEWKLLL